MHFDVQNQDFTANTDGKKIGKQHEKVVFADCSYFIWTEEVGSNHGYVFLVVPSVLRSLAN